MKISKILGSVCMVAVAALALTGCGQNNNDSNTQQGAKFPTAVPKKPAKQGGSINIALETDTPFMGIFNYELEYDDADFNAEGPANESLFDTDNKLKITDKGPAILRINRKAKTATITVKKGVRWSDGHQVNAKDMEYAYEILANKKTHDIRYNSDLEHIKGMAAYHQGKANKISGIEMPDGNNGRTIILHYYQLKPDMYYDMNHYFWESAAPYHQLKNVPFNKLISCDQVRKHPLFFGPFKVSKIVHGQSVTYTPNKYYWRGKPKLNRITISVISPNSVSQAIKSHKFDIINVINSQWKQVKSTKGYTFVGQLPLAFNYLGFKVGKYDAKAGKNIMNQHAKMANKALRQAIGYGMNVAAVDKRYTDGLSFPVHTLIPKARGDYHDNSIKGYNFNLKKANRILDKAGYKKKGRWRVQPNGKPLTIHLLVMSGDELQIPITQNYIQQWRKLGLHVKLVGGRLTESNLYNDKLQNDSPDVDMFEANWDSWDLSQYLGFGNTSPMNYERFVTNKNTQLINEMDSQKSFNHKYRVKVFHKWQKYMFNEAVAIPMDTSYIVTAVNNKLTGYSTEWSQGNNEYPLWYKIGYAK